jgi:hypothetical protein
LRIPGDRSKTCRTFFEGVKITGNVNAGLLVQLRNCL